ncbi:MAG: peptide-methionine (S)-S-oxide reductase, partial [Phycisphaerae bacterium]
PTQRDRQGPDVGSQYRSAIFFHTPQQQEAVRASIEALTASGRFDRPLATQVAEASTFWRAEEYHQRYVEKHGGGGCSIGPDSSSE